jgi:hypothetical protein
MSYVQTDYLSDLRNTYSLIEKIKAYYISQGISTHGMKFEVEKSMDQWGSKIYSIRSNIKYNLTKGRMELV